MGNFRRGSCGRPRDELKSRITLPLLRETDTHSEMSAREKVVSLSQIIDAHL